MSDSFMKINCNEVESILKSKIDSEPIKEEENIKYRNFVIMDLIERIDLENYADFGFSKVLAAFFDISINTKVSRVTLDDFNKVNKTMSEMEKAINDNVKTNGTIYFARHNNDFSLMYYEILD